MKKPYRFTKKASKPYYYVTFAHIPGRWFSTGSATLEGAIDFARRKMGVHDEERREPTLREFATGFFSDADPHGYRHRLERRDTFYERSYYEQHTSRLERHILKAHGEYLLSSITEFEIEDFILDLDLANSSRNKVLACYRIVLEQAVREGYMTYNPAAKVKELPPRYRERDVFTKEEYAAMFPALDEDVISFWGDLKWAVYFCILKDTGWRPAEVAGLSKSNFFPELKGIYTTCSVDYRTHRLKQSIKTTRRGQPFKEGFLSDQTCRLLDKWILNCPTEQLFPLSRWGKDGGLIYPECANKHLRCCWRKAGMDLKGRTQYCFRHTFNTRSLGHLPEVARLLLMGHTRNRQEYNHLTPRQALERVLSIDGVEKALKKIQ